MIEKLLDSDIDKLEEAIRTNNYKEIDRILNVLDKHYGGYKDLLLKAIEEHFDKMITPSK